MINIFFAFKRSSYILFAIVILSFISCKQRNDTDKESTIIKGSIHYAEKNQIYLYRFANETNKYLGIKSLMDSSLIDKEGNYYFSISLNNPELFDLRIANTTQVSNFYISPKDQLTIDFYNKDYKPVITKDSPVAKKNQFILSLIDTFYEKPSVKHLYYIQTNYLTPVEYIFYNKDRLQKQLKFYENYFEGAATDTAFHNFIVNEIIYQSAVDRLMYSWKKRMKGENKNIDTTFYDFLTPDLIENSRALSSIAYHHFLNLFVKDIYERKLEAGQIPVNKNEKLIPSMEKIKIAEEKLKKPFLDVVLINIIHDDVSTSNPELLNTLSDTSVDSLLNWIKVKYANTN
jgi:hypothetical protein